MLVKNAMRHRKYDYLAVFHDPSAGERHRELWHRAWLGAAAESRTLEPEAERCRFDENGVAMPAKIAAHTALAAIAHVAAHRMFGAGRFDVGALRPLQVALVALVEDARVEQLAMRERPGLRKLWAPYFAPDAGDIATVPALLRQLACALFDCHVPAAHAWVEKGRRLFVDDSSGWRDPALSRQIGNLLGNDLGQMRLQFNWKSYCVEPAYRDDNHGLWDFPPPDDSPPTPRNLQLESGAGGSPSAATTENGAGAAQHGDELTAIGVDDPATIALPEWDYALQAYRPGSVTARMQRAQGADGSALETLLAAQAVQLRRLNTLLQAARQRRIKLKRQRSGDAFDLDACVAAVVARRISGHIDDRLHIERRKIRAGLALQLLIDASLSTAAPDSNGSASLLQHEIDAATLLGQAAADSGDAFAIHALQSCGRLDVRHIALKDFDEPWSGAVRERLAGLAPALSTRLGAALRCAGIALQRRAEPQRLLFVLSDGEPADIDSGDRRYLIEDARMAVRELAHAGIEVFCCGLDPAASADLEHIFGRRRVALIAGVERLSAQLQKLYLQLAR